MDEDVVYALLPFVTIVALGAGFWFAFRQRPGARRWRAPRDGDMDPKTNGHSRRGPEV